ncbi:MAG TPA: hypothetical protein VGD69_25365 [Herpetosiphonaceae bacterium]
MARQLEIHHIDVGQGDSTLILVYEMSTVPPTLQKSVLIDAGLFCKGRVVQRYIRSLNIPRIDMMIASHFDRDHFYGLRSLLATNNAMFANTRIYDRGEIGMVNLYGNVTLGRSDPYAKYIADSGVRDAGQPANAYRNTYPPRPNRRRPTTWINTIDNTPPIPNGWDGEPDVPTNDQWRRPNWLATRPEVLQIPANGPADHPPTMINIAANQYVRRTNAQPLWVFSLAIDDNPESLGWLLRFNNFSYYSAGDLTIPLEEQAALYTGNVTALKLSHHGANTSTSQTFIDRLNPRVAVISCGYNNSYGHPTQTIVNRLEAKASIENYFLTSCGANNNLLPGCSGTNQWTADTKSRVSGAQNPAHPGHVIIRVTEAQSLATPGFSVRYYEDDIAGWARITYF